MDHLLVRAVETKCTGHGIIRFVPRRTLRRLGPGNVRCPASIEGLTGTRLCSCVQTADGLHVVEVADEHHRDELLIPVLHVQVDQGSVGGQFLQWLICSGMVRGTLELDHYRREPNDAKATLLTNERTLA